MYPSSSRHTGDILGEATSTSVAAIPPIVSPASTGLPLAAVPLVSSTNTSRQQGAGRGENSTTNNRDNNTVTDDDDLVEDVDLDELNAGDGEEDEDDDSQQGDDEADEMNLVSSSESEGSASDSEVSQVLWKCLVFRRY